MMRNPGWGLIVVAALLGGCLTPVNQTDIFAAADIPLPGALDSEPPRPQYTDARGLPVEDPGWWSPGAAPRFRIAGLPNSGAEPNLGFTKRGNLFVTNFDEVYVSPDLGRTWNLSHEFRSLNVPASQDTFVTGDPMLWVDRVTDRVFVAHLEALAVINPLTSQPWCTYLTYSDDQGATWKDEELPRGVGGAARSTTCLVPVVDHQKLVTSRPGPKTQPIWVPENRPYPNILYMCYNKFDPSGGVGSRAPTVAQDAITGTYCELSFDGGDTFVRSQRVHPIDRGCSGIAGHPAVHPDGTIMVALSGVGTMCNRPPIVVVSEDSGQSWTARVAPKEFGHQLEIDADLAITPDGTAYLLYRDSDQIVHLARSRDKFATWEGPFRVSPADQRLNVFTAAVSMGDGRLAMAYVGSRDAQDPGATPSNASQGTRWHAFVTISHDSDAAQPRFVTFQLTTQADPLQVGCVWLNGAGGGPRSCRNLLDFIDIDRSEDGVIAAAFTDGCTARNGCAGDPNSANLQSRDRQVMVAVEVR